MMGTPWLPRVLFYIIWNWHARLYLSLDFQLCQSNTNCWLERALAERAGDFIWGCAGPAQKFREERERFISAVVETSARGMLIIYYYFKRAKIKRPWILLQCQPRSHRRAHNLPICRCERARCSLVVAPQAQTYIKYALCLLWVYLCAKFSAQGPIHLSPRW